MITDVEVKRLWWHSRRGMLELDVLLIPFVEEAYQGLADEDKARYRQLVDCEDPDLYTWFMEQIPPEDPDLNRIVQLVLEHTRSKQPR